MYKKSKMALPMEELPPCLYSHHLTALSYRWILTVKGVVLSDLRLFNSIFIFFLCHEQPIPVTQALQLLLALCFISLIALSCKIPFKSLHVQNNLGNSLPPKVPNTVSSELTLTYTI